MRRLVALVAAGLGLAACGSTTPASALASWVSQSGFIANSRTLVGDARHAASALRRADASAGQLHLVCAVLLVDTESLNASLPTPDATTTQLLSRAYTLLGEGANLCYRAAGSVPRRAVALGKLSAGAAALSEAEARVANAGG